MPASTTMSYHVAGPIVPQLNIGSLNAFVSIGVCQDGATVDLEPATHGIMSDGGGGPSGKPVEYIQLNYVATVRFKLVPFAGTYVNKLRAMAIASATDGTPPTPGTLFGANGYLPSLYLPSADGDGPWLFNNVKVVRPGSVNVNTKESTPDWEFSAMAYFDPATYTSVSGRPVYTRAAP